MAFGILLRDPDKLFTGAFEALLEDTAYALSSEDKVTDWSDVEAINAGFGRRPPKAIVNFIPDNFEAIDKLSLQSTQALVQYCTRKKMPLIHVSSYRVYGLSYQEKGWRESDDAQPDDKVGKKLLELEECVQEHKKHLILRTGWLLEGKQNGLLDRFLPSMMKGKSLVVSDHRFGSPLPNRFIARVLFAMIQQTLCGATNWGIFNVHSSDKCSEAEFADQLFRLLVNEFKCEVPPPTVAGADDDRYFIEGCAHLLGRRCTANFGIQLPTWRSGFARQVKAWLERQAEPEPTKEQA